MSRRAAGETAPTRFRRLAALAGMVAPALFAVALIVVTWAEYDFVQELGWTLTDHSDSAWPSGLAQGQHGWAQIVNYAVFGLLLLVFFTRLRGDRRRRSRRVAGALLVVFAAGFIFAAFPEDGPPFGDPETWAGYLHGVGVVTLALSSFSSMIATAVALRGNERWRGYPVISAVAGVAVFVFLFVLVLALEVATTLGVYGYFLILLGWVELMAIRLWRLER